MKLIVVPYAGLCNRLNAILSAIALQQERRIAIEVYWEKTNDCFAWFDELFEQNLVLQIHRLREFYLKPSCKRNLFLPSLLRRFVFDASYIGQNISNSQIFLEDNALGNVYVSSTNRFCPLCITSSLSEYFVPLPHIQQKIDSVVSKYSTSTVGVHIRRTDNIAAIQNSPIEKYIEAMNAIIAHDKNTIFYIATDDQEVKSSLQKMYGSRILTYEATLNRNTQTGIEDAIVELWCLASCSKIIGSTHSTYSEFASMIYNAPIAYISNK